MTGVRKVVGNAFKQKMKNTSKTNAKFKPEPSASKWSSALFVLCSGSVKPSPLGSRQSAQGILEMINLWRPVIVEVEDEVLSVLCGTRDIAQETSRRRDEMNKHYFGHTIRLTLSHRCGTRNECNVMC